MFYLILFLTLFSTLFAQEEETSLLTPLATDPSALVEGGINIITGQPSIAIEDLVIQGAEPIRIGRFLIEPDKWLIGVTTAEINSIDTKIIISDKHGLRIIYREAGNERIGGKKFQRYVPSRKNRGFSNTYQGKISSQTNIKNNYVLLDKENRKDLTVHCADGTIQNYKRIRHNKNKFQLISEHLPNGNWLFYNYDNDIDSEKPGPLTSISSRDPSQKRELASAFFSYKGNHLQISGSDGQVLEYFFQEKDQSPFKSLRTVMSPDDANKRTDYVYSEYTLTFDDDKKTKRDERRLGLINLSLKKLYEIDYYKDKKEIVAGQTIKIKDHYFKGEFIPDFRRNRVKTLSAPIGLDSKPTVTHSFIYPFEDWGYTERVSKFGIRQRFKPSLSIRKNGPYF